MSRPSCVALGFGLGALVVAPVIAPLGLWLFERHLKREGLVEWVRR